MNEENFKIIPLDKIDMNADNEALFGYEDIEYLANNIKENGFHGAIEVYAKNDGRYEINSGHRRYLAVKSLGYTEIPCMVEADVDDESKTKKLILSNIHTRKLDPYHIAKCMDYYSKHVLDNSQRGQGRKRDVLGQVFNVSGITVQRTLNILKLIPEFQKLAQRKEFSIYTYYPVTLLKEDEQREVYRLLSMLAQNGEEDMASFTAPYINQAITKMQRIMSLREKGIADEKDRAKDLLLRNKNISDDAEDAEEKYRPDGIGLDSDYIDEEEVWLDSPSSESEVSNTGMRSITDAEREDFIADAAVTSRYLDEEVIRLGEQLYNLLISGKSFSTKQAKYDAISECQKILNEVKMI